MEGDKRTLSQRIGDGIVAFLAGVIVIAIGLATVIGALYLGAPVWLAVVAAIAFALFSLWLMAILAPKTARRAWDGLLNGLGSVNF